MYKLELARSVVKELASLKLADSALFQRITSAISALSDNPFLGKPLKGPLKGDYSLRVGSYRILYTVYKEKLVVYVLDLGHRRDIYR